MLEPRNDEGPIRRCWERVSLPPVAVAWEAPMAIEVTKLVWRVPLAPGDNHVLLALADHASADGTNIFPGTARLASMTGYCERSIQKIRKRLVQSGLLIVTRKSTPTSPTHYRIDLEELRRRADTAELSSPPEPGSPPELSSPPEPSDPEGVNSVPRGGEPSSPKPPREPPKEPPPPAAGSGASDDLEAGVEAEYQQAASRTTITNPDSYRAGIRRRIQEERRAAEENAERKRERQSTIDACNLCNRDGIILLETDDGPLTYQCTHNQRDYRRYEIATATTEPKNVMA
jgi:hypothetical protein